MGYAAHRAQSQASCATTTPRPTTRSAIPSYLVTQPKPVLHPIRALPKALPQTTLPSVKSLTLMRAMTSCPSETFIFSAHHKLCLQPRLLPLSLSNTPGHRSWCMALAIPHKHSGSSCPSWMRPAVISLHQVHDHLQAIVPHHPCPTVRCIWHTAAFNSSH